MESMLVLKNVPTTTVTTVASITDQIAPGELVAVGDGKVVLTGVAGELLHIQRVTFMTKKDDGTIISSVPIPRRAVTNVNIQIYKAPVVAVYTMGSTTTSVLPYDPLVRREYSMVVNNLSYNHAISKQRQFANLMNNIGETKLAFYTRFTAVLNGATNINTSGINNPFFTAVVSGANDNILITFTMKTTDVDFSTSRQGALEGTPVVKTVSAVPGVGVGADVLAMEKDYQGNLGKSQSLENADVWFSSSLDTVASGTYTIPTITWSGINDSPTHKRVIATNTLQLPYPSGATAVGTKIATLFAAIFGDAWTGNEPLNNAEPGDGTPDNDAFNRTVTIGS